ncbi:hypothetical protein CYLTODRAFT_422281 [Cylindrobasidium torrendii FP15055 ss-10]|uniref:Uncharacterized protein n=1 Tax=Cylindrobasidium torrendii FP15055 ss-10 TaxID=1314674 RepID=A0A0D7BB01_9AGAR|nr:hypothetical protein CYLTODRAFT_422281 [Cylindrobasidium torrendii FP15055 ss-10]
MASTPLPPAPPSSPATRPPHVVVHPPEEDCDPPYTCYDADEPLDTDPDVLHAIHSLHHPQHSQQQSETDDEDEIFEVVRVRRRRSGEDEAEYNNRVSGDDADKERTPRATRRRSIFSFRKSTDSSAVTRKSLDSRQSLDTPDDEETPRSSSPTPSFFARRFSIFSSTPSIPSLVSLPSFRRSRSTSRQSESESSSSSSAGPDTPSEDLSQGPHSPPRMAPTTPVQEDYQPQLKTKGSKILRRLSSFRKPKPAAMVPLPADPVDDDVLDEDDEGEIRLDSFHFSDDGFSFDADRFRLE